jgi:RNA polymerase-binding transcription factor DksA
MKLSATYLYSGLPDYWSGNGDRWDDDKGCVFASYGSRTTLQQLVEDAVSDFNMGGDFESFPEDISDDDVREALLESLTDQGREDYYKEVVWDGAVEYMEINGFDRCKDCGNYIGTEHSDECEFAPDGDVEEEHTGEYDCEPPVVIWLLEILS